MVLSGLLRFAGGSRRGCHSVLTPFKPSLYPGLVLALFLCVFGPIPTHAQQGGFVTDKFCGMNDTDSPATLADCEAQDSLNAETDLNGLTLKKRRGFSLEATLTTASAPVTGSAYFRDTSGNDIVVACHDIFCAKSSNKAAFTNFLTTATAGTKRWSFATVDSILYGANDSRDKVFRYNGTSILYSTAIPQGTILELAGDRLVVADVANFPNRVHYSKSGDFTNFTTGLLPVDPWTDDMGTFGDKVTGLKAWLGNIYIFKSQSITICELGDQYTTLCSVLSNTVGTNDPASIILTSIGIVFKGSDSGYWRIGLDGSITSISRKITNLTATQNLQNQSLTETTQTDWEAGSESPINTWDTSSISGSVFPSSTSKTWDSTAQFLNGTVSSVTVSTSGTVELLRNLPFFNADLSNGNALGWTLSGFSYVAKDSLNDGAVCVDTLPVVGGLRTSGLVGGLNIRVYYATGTAILAQNSHTFSDSIAAGYCDQSKITQTEINKYFTSTLRIEVTNQGSGYARSVYFSSASEIVYYWGHYTNTANPGSGAQGFIVFISTGFTSGTFQSETFDTSFATPTGGPFTAAWSTPSASNATLYYDVRSATSSDGIWNDWRATSNTLNAGTTQQYIQWRGRFNVTRSSAGDSPSLDSVTMNAASTGTFMTQCMNAGLLINSFGLISCAEGKTGAGNLTYYTKSDSTCSALSTNTWTAQTNNTDVSVSAKAALQIRFDSTLGSSSDTARVDSCVVYWNGPLAPPSWGLYDSTLNHAYWSTGINYSTVSNRVLKYDMNNGAFYPLDLPASSMLIVNNDKYFGGSLGGYLFKYAGSGINTDNNAAINSYWKSKDWTGSSPFYEKSWTRISSLFANEQTGSITTTWTNERGVSGSYSVSLSTASAYPYVRSNYNIPTTSPSNFINFRFGNNAANQPWEMLGYGVDYFTQPWRPLSP